LSVAFTRTSEKREELCIDASNPKQKNPKKQKQTWSPLVAAVCGSIPQDPDFHLVMGTGSMDEIWNTNWILRTGVNK